jgi:hypothetical protein
MQWGLGLLFTRLPTTLPGIGTVFSNTSGHDALAFTSKREKKKLSK